MYIFVIKFFKIIQILFVIVIENALNKKNIRVKSYKTFNENEKMMHEINKKHYIIMYSITKNLNYKFLTFIINN